MSCVDLFTTLNEYGIPYVVLRKYEGLPDDPGDDVDILIRNEGFDDCINLCKQLGFEYWTRNTPKTVAGMALAGIREPKKAVRMITQPTAVLSTFHRRHKHGTVNPKTGLRIVKLVNGETKLDLQNCSAYISPRTGKHVRVDPHIDDRMFESSQLYNGIKVPSPPHELGHIVPHCVFDKEGEFSEYYVSRCDELSEIVLSDPEYRSQFEEVLSLVFLQNSQLVYDRVANSEYQSIRSELQRDDDLIIDTDHISGEPMTPI